VVAEDGLPGPPAVHPLARFWKSPGPDDGSRMTRECHVRFCVEAGGVKFPRPTHQVGHAEGPTKPRSDSQRLFHFDYAGWHSLNLFIYLIEVGADSGAHQVVAGTHRSRKLWDAVRPSIPDDEITKRFGGNIRTITGPAGTMFFEDTAAFHRRLILKRRRVMLNILYASHRSWLSKGRLTPKYAEYLRSPGIA